MTTRQPNFKLVRDELLGRIGDVKVVTVNYSQNSSRYDAFRAGEVLPAFDPAKAGGANMDLGLYTLTYTIGLFGEPAKATYLPNIERGIDTSGIALLDYDGFRAVNICAKDCGAPSVMQIQGTDGYIVSKSQPNLCGAVTLEPKSYDFENLPTPEELEPAHPEYATESRGLGAADLARAVAEGRAPRASAQMACHVLEVCDAILESARTGAFVHVSSTCERPQAL